MNRAWIVWIASLGLLAGCSAGPPDAQVAAPRHDFGALAQRAEAEHVFVVRNSGGQVLHLTEVKDTCPCTQSEILTTDVPAGGEGRVRTVFSASWFQGELEKSILLTTDDPDQPLVELLVAATVEVDLAVEPRVHHLGDVAAGQAVSVATLLTNRTDHPVRLEGIELPGPEVTLPDPPFAQLTPDRPLELQPGQALTLRLAAVPPPGEGTFTRKVVLTVAGARPGAFPVLLMGRYGSE